jgi:hypothetical protein
LSKTVVGNKDLQQNIDTCTKHSNEYNQSNNNYHHHYILSLIFIFLAFMMPPHENAVKIMVQGTESLESDDDFQQRNVPQNSINDMGGHPNSAITTTNTTSASSVSPPGHPLVWSQPTTDQHTKHHWSIPTGSPAVVSIDSETPSVYDLFHLHYQPEEDQDASAGSPLLIFPQNSGSIRSTTTTPSILSRASNFYDHHGMQLPSRPPPTTIQTRQPQQQQPVDAKNANDPMTGFSERSSSPSATIMPFPSQPPSWVSSLLYRGSISHSGTTRLLSQPPLVKRRHGDFNHHNSNNHHNDTETTPLFYKMREIQRREDPDYISMTSNHSSAYTLCGFCCSWLVWVSIWILLFASVIHHHDADSINNNASTTLADAATDAAVATTVVTSPVGDTTITTTITANLSSQQPWTRLERIFFAASTFWTIGFGDYLVTTNQDRSLTCAFMIISLCFYALALGRWGNSVIEAYKAASLTHSTNKRQRQQRYHYQPNAKENVVDQNDHIDHADNDDDPMLSFLWHTHNRTLTTSTISRRYSSSNNSFLSEEEFVIFPGLPWLLVQSLFMTASTIICVFAIQYYEQNEQVSDEWTAISTLYFAISTAMTVGFGDVVPTTRQGQILCIFFLPLAVGTSLHWMVWMAQRGIQRTQRNMIHRRDLSNLRLDEFYERKLQSMGLVDAATFVNLRREYELMS